MLCVTTFLHYRCFFGLGSQVAYGVTLFFLFWGFRHQPGWRAQATQVKDHQAVCRRHVQVSPPCLCREGQQLWQMGIWSCIAEDKKTEGKCSEKLEVFHNNKPSPLFFHAAVLRLTSTTTFRGTITTGGLQHVSTSFGLWQFLFKRKCPL